MKVNGVTVTSGTASAALPLVVGDNPYNTVVTAQDGTTTKTYTVTVHRRSNVATLSSLSLSGVTLSPTFASGTFSYTATVPYPTANTTVSATTTHALASASGTGVQPLNVGANTLTVTVTAEDGNTQPYTVVVTRTAPGTNADLSNLVPTPGTLSPTFASGTTSYTVNVSNATTSITLTPTVADATATVKVNGVTVTSGTASAALPLVVGDNVYNTVVTAQDGTTTKTYTVTVHRRSNVATLSALSLSGVTLSPTFASGTFSYTAAVPFTTTSTTVSATTTHALASASGTGVQPLNVGTNTLTATVTAEDGNTQPYTVVVNRAVSNNSLLSSLTLGGAQFIGTFDPHIFSYQAYALNASVTATPTAADANATIRVNGNAVTSGSASNAIIVNLLDGNFTIVVTAPDGITTSTYTVLVLPYTLDATLKSLALSTGTLNPSFASTTTDYAVTVPYHTTSSTLTPTANDARTTITQNGGATATPVSLNVGANTINLLVTAMGSFNTKTYRVTVTRSFADATLSNLAITTAALSPSFNSATQTYTATAIPGAQSVTVTPTTNDPLATVTVNGNSTASGTASTPIALTGPLTPLLIVVTGADGVTTTTYSAPITLPPGLTATFTSASFVPLTLNGYAASGPVTLSLAFAPTAGTQLTVVNNTGSSAITGTFNNLTEGQLISMPFASNIYTFVASYVGGTGNDLVLTLDPAGLPLWKTQPTSRLVGVGQAITLNAFAQGNVQSQQWLRNNQAMSGESNWALSIPAAAAANSGAYACRCANGNGSTTSTLANVGVLTLLPSTVSGVEGGNVTLSITASGPGMTFEWRKHGVRMSNGVNPLHSDSTISGVSTSRLSITATSQADSDVYVCHVSMPDPQHPGTPLQADGGSITLGVTADTTRLVYTPGTWIVSGSVNEFVLSRNGATSFAMSGQPAGVSIDNTGHITGRPAIEISTPTVYHLSITGRGPNGTSGPLTVDVLVQPIPAHAVGTFNGVIDKDASLSNNDGGSLTMTVTITGMLTGKVTLAASTWSFAGQLDTSPTNDPVLNATITRPSLSSLQLAATIDRAAGALTGTLSAASITTAVSAWQNPWDARTNPAPLACTYTMAMTLDSAFQGTASNPENVAYPQGTGFATVTALTDGSVSLAGRLADGTAVTFSTTYGLEGDMPLHVMLYSNTGSLHGQAVLSSINSGDNILRYVDGDVYWRKSAQGSGSTDRVYKQGFPSHHLTVAGGEYLAPPPGTLVLGLKETQPTVANAMLTFAEGGLAGPPPITASAMAGDLSKDWRLSSFAAPAIPPGIGNPAAVHLVLTPSNGLFSGTFTLKDADPTDLVPPFATVTRTVNFSGVVVERADINCGIGSFLLPELPSLAPLTTQSSSPVLSGKVLLKGK